MSAKKQLEIVLQQMQQQGLIQMAEDGKYTLTENGEEAVSRLKEAGLLNSAGNLTDEGKAVAESNLI